MAKLKEITNLPDVSNQNYELIKAGVHVYPEFMKDPITKKWSWYILYSDKGKVIKKKKKKSSNEKNISLHLAILSRFKKLTKK